MKPDYKNWVPKGMIYGLLAGTGALGAGLTTSLFLTKDSSAPVRIGLNTALGLGAIACAKAAQWSVYAYNQFLTAIDYSEVSVEKAAAYNSEEIRLGRCKVQQGDISALTLPEESFDLATAFETIYFWPGLEKCFAQAAKVLKPGGVFIIVNESDGMDKASLKFEKIIDGMKCYTVEEIEAGLKSAGFSKIKADHHKSKPWITVIAKKS